MPHNRLTIQQIETVLAVIRTVLLLRTYLEGHQFSIRTDNDEFKSIHNLVDARGKLPLWRLCLLECEFDVVHRPGNENLAAALLQLDQGGMDNTELDNDLPEMALSSNKHLKGKINADIDGSSDLICICQQFDDTFATVINALP